MEQLGPFLAGVGVTVFFVFLITRIARNKYDVVEKKPPEGGSGGGGGRTPPRDTHLK